MVIDGLGSVPTLPSGESRSSLPVRKVHRPARTQSLPQPQTEQRTDYRSAIRTTAARMAEVQTVATRAAVGLDRLEMVREHLRAVASAPTDDNRERLAQAVSSATFAGQPLFREKDAAALRLEPPGGGTLSERFALAEETAQALEAALLDQRQQAERTLARLDVERSNRSAAEGAESTPHALVVGLADRLTRAGSSPAVSHLDPGRVLQLMER